MAPKINVKERFSDGEIDLSMSDLEEVPLKEIVQLKKAYGLDLSNNRLTLLPKAFPTLTQLTKLDLSKNELKELPEDFGNLIKLRHLDLYRNQIQHIPLSFSKLKDLKWLDLKDNPLVPTVAKVAGPCLDTKQCQNCARDVVNFFAKLERQVNVELEMRNKTRQKQLEINQQKKQEEKRVKKKEKQKNKRDVEVIQKNSTSKTKMKKYIKNHHQEIITKQKKPSSSIFGKLLVFTFISGLILFVLTSVKVKHTEKVEVFTMDIYATLLEKVPSSFKEYVVQVGHYFHQAHEKTGYAIVGLGKYVNDNFPQSKREQLYENITNILQSFVEKITEIYNNIVSS